MTKYRVYPAGGNGFILHCNKITQEGEITWCDNTGYVNTPLRIEREEGTAPLNETGESNEPANSKVSPERRSWFKCFIDWIDDHQG